MNIFSLHRVIILLFVIFNPCSFLQAKEITGVELLDILNRLKTSHNVTFLYEPSTIEGVIITTPFDYKDKVKTIFKAILPPVGLKYKKVGKRNYVIKKAKNYLEKQRQPKILPPNLSSKRTKFQTIQGFLYDETTKERLIGATIQLKDKSIGTTTDLEGRYSLRIPIGKQVVIFSYIGFESKEISIQHQVEQNIGLKMATSHFNEIIVTAVGIETNKRTLGYAADNFQIKDLSNTTQPNLISALSGQSAGVWVNTTSGSPGASASIFIRGLRSVNGSNKPLFILDGIPIDNTTTGNGTGGVDVSNRLIDLNTHDLDKITILKGAAATALYGIRAANGAVVMVSKKGKTGKPTIAFSSSWGSSTVSQLPARQTEYAQGKYKEGEAVYLGPETNTPSSYGALVNSLEFDGDSTYPYDNNGRLVPIGQGNGNPAKIYDAYPTFFVKGQIFNNHLSISGGTNLLDYYLSFGQFKEMGVVPNSTFERYSLKGVFNVKLHKKLTIGSSSYLTQSNGFRMKRGSLFSGVPLGLFRNPITFDIGNGLVGNEAANTSSSYSFDNGRQRAFRGNGRYDNPFWSVNRNPFEDKVNRLIQTISFDYKFNNWLKANYKTSLDIYTDNRKNAYDINSGTHRKGQINLFDIQSTHINSDFLLTMNRPLNEQWTLKTILGHNYYTSEFSMEETIGEELEKQGIYQISNAIYTSTEASFLQKKLMGVFADIHLQYKDALFFNFTGRKDWSSTLPQENNTFFYPSLNMGIEFTKLLNWTDKLQLSYGKFRFSISQVGNDAGTYLTNTYFNPATVNGDNLLPNTSFPAFGVSAFERGGTLGNVNLKPETTTAYEIGTDLKWLKGQVCLDLTWYKSIHQDQIINTQLSAASGFLNMPINGGIVENQGFEVTLKITPIQKNDFKWTIKANFSTFESIVTDLPDNNVGIVLASFTNVSSMILEGQPYGVLVGTSIKRNEQGQRIIDQDGFPKVNEIHTIIGNPNPDWLLGIQQQLTWKGFSLSALLDIRKGGDIWNGTKGVMSFLGISRESGDQRMVENYVFEGVTETGAINTQAVDLANPANGMEGIYWRRYGFIGLAENHIEDGSWFRLRTINLAYHFSPKQLKFLKSKVTLSLEGHNIFLKTNYSGVDPETNLRGDSNILGWDYFNMPSTKRWTVQLKAQF